MNQAVNPYAPPGASLIRDANEDSPGIWREGKLLIVEKDAQLPSRCIRCNAEVSEPARERKIYWHSPWLYLLILVNIIVYAIGALIARKTAKVNPALCPTHHRNRLLVLWLGFSSAVLLFILTFFAFVNDYPLAGGLCVLAFLIALITVSVKGRIFLPVKITKEEARIKGCGEAFLDSLPER